jgi:pyrroline-5-carboxylate reductase
MKNKSFGFIGGGRITKIILEGLRRKKSLPDEIHVSDPDREVLQKLKNEFPSISIYNTNEKPASQDFVFVSLHPPVFKEVMEKVKGNIKMGSIILSLAPKLSIDKIKAILDGYDKIARINPNAPSYVNSGFNPVAFSSSLTNEDRKEITDIFKNLGAFPEVEEKNIEAYAITSAMGPTYFWPQLYELKELAISFGLSENEAKDAIENMIIGAVKTMFESNLEPKEVMDLVPVKPLGDEEENIKNIYRSKLKPLFEKLKS